MEHVGPGHAAGLIAPSGRPAHQDAIDLEGRAALVLVFDAEVPPPRLDNAGGVLYVGARAPRDAAALPWSALRALVPDPRLAALRPTDAVVSPLRGATVRDVLAAIRLGVRRFHVYLAPGAVFRTNPRGMLVLAARRRAVRTLLAVPGLARSLEEALDVRLDPPWPKPADTRRAAGAALRHARATRRRPRTGGPLRVVHYLGGLGPGGAERQLTYVARGARAAGHDVRVLTAFPLAGEAAHYAGALEADGVPCRALGATWRAGPTVRALPPEVRRRIEGHVAWPAIAPLVEELAALRPDVLHAWMDHGNTVGAIAALLAGVPRLVLSLRSVAPEAFPHLFQPWFRATYRLLARAPEVTLVANSRAGAQDYARWLGIDPARVLVVHNGVPLPDRALDAAERRARRRALGVPDDAFVVVGVLRLSAEKRPLDFVAALREAARQVPALRAFHVGVGPLGDEVRRAAADLGERLVLLGRQPEPARWLEVADACLLTSALEGCPNVPLEAQALGVPVVLTRGGGAPETVEHGRTGFVADVGDTRALAGYLVELARDPARARGMGEAGRSFVAARFSVEVMVRRTLALYEPTGGRAAAAP